ncbi:hypothetical protein HY493_00945 [Candidatus Woesearchaeota archaeon]|nr:hypothetical protein [Candidatus Woesearchaeota archaeon]
MSDALDDLLYEFRGFAFDWDEVGRRMEGRKYEQGHFQGLAGKHALRIFIEGFMKTHPAVTLLELPTHPSYRLSDGGDFVAIKQGGRMVTTIDTPLRFEDRPLLIDIKLNEWHNVLRGYFAEKHRHKRAILEDIFGRERYDHAILVPYAMTRWHGGSNIVRLRFSAEDFREQADAEGEKRGLV